MLYLKITKEEIDLSKMDLINTIYLELDASGIVLRELGYDEHDNLIHKCPGKYSKYGEYGIFDLAPFDVTNLESNLTSEDFEKLWTQ